MSRVAKAVLAAVAGAAFITALAFGLTRDPRVLPGAVVGKPAPRFALESIDGDRVSSGALKGQPMLINFWASWCSECKKEHPYLMQAHDRWGSDVEFIGVVFQDTRENIRRFLLERGEDPRHGYANLLDPGSRVAIDYGVYGIPETFFIDRKGTVVHKQVGRVSPELLRRELRRIMR